MRGFFTVELLLVLFLLPCVLFLIDADPPPVLRETSILAQDAAQMLMYGHSIHELPGETRFWLDGNTTSDCPYRFRYCTHRIFEGGEHRICAAECSQ